MTNAQRDILRELARVQRSIAHEYRDVPVKAIIHEQYAEACEAALADSELCGCKLVVGSGTHCCTKQQRHSGDHHDHRTGRFWHNHDEVQTLCGIQSEELMGGKILLCTMNVGHPGVHYNHSHAYQWER